MSNNIEDRLWQKPTRKPKRQLSSGFTSQTMERIAKTKEQTSVFARASSIIRGAFHMHTFTKPAALAIGLAIIGITAGTGYAALKWLAPNTTLDTNSVTTLPNGNKRFWVHSDSCQGQGGRETPVDSHYEIKAGSKTTPEDIRKSVEASCETDLLPQLFPEIITQSKGVSDFQPHDKQFFTPWVKVEGINKDGLKVRGKLNGRDYGMTVLPIDKDARVYSKGKKIAMENLKTGDWITLVSYTTELEQPFATETMPPGEVEKLAKDGFPIGSRVSGMIKHQYSPEDAMGTLGVMGEDWTRLVEDKNSSDGWRQLIPLDHDWNKYKQHYENN